MNATAPSTNAPTTSHTSSKATAFWDKIAEKYAAQPIRNPDAYERTLERLRHYFKPSHRVLELGCGTGATALKLADAVERYEASDFSPAMIDIAQARDGATNIKNLSFIVADPFDPRFKEGAYDVVFASSFLHLVEDVDETLARIHTLLKPGGLFIGKTMCLSKSVVFRVAIPLLQLVGKAPKVHFLAVADHDAAVRKAGFEILETGMYPAPNRFVVGHKS
ncbi:MAG: class I SAM-dependent methyltransferase [Pseudomonadota bacterium]